MHLQSLRCCGPAYGGLGIDPMRWPSHVTYAAEAPGTFTACCSLDARLNLATDSRASQASWLATWCLPPANTFGTASPLATHPLQHNAVCSRQATTTVPTAPTSHFERAICAEQQILRLDVPVDDLQRVQVLQCCQEGSHHGAHSLLLGDAVRQRHASGVSGSERVRKRLVRSHQTWFQMRVQLRVVHLRSGARTGAAWGTPCHGHLLAVCMVCIIQQSAH